MKSKFLLGLSTLVLLGGLFSCTSETSSSTPDSSTLESSISSSVIEVLPDLVISLNRTSVSMDAGDTYTLRATVVGKAEDLTVTFSVADSSVASLSTTGPATSTTITGLKAGTTTVTATCVANPNVTATCTVTITEARPTPAALFENLNNIRNYTLTSTVTTNEGTYKWKTYLTDEALVQYVADEDETFFSPMWVGFDEDGNTLDTASSIGLFVDEDGYAAYISYETSIDSQGNLVMGDFIQPGRIISDNGGFLTADNFDGKGVSRPADSNYLYSSLSCIDASYFPDEKERDNTYEIVGTSNDIYSTHVEYGLLKVFANDILQDVISSVATNGTYYLYDVAEAIDTTIEVISSDSFEVTITFGSVTIIGTISNVGSTSLADVSLIPTLASDIAGVTATLPELSRNLQRIADAFKSDNYVQENIVYFYSSSYIETYYETYYADDYVVMYYGQDYVDTYNSLYGESISPFGLALFVANGTLYSTYFEGDEFDTPSSINYPLEEGDTIQDVDLTRITISSSTIFGANYFTHTDLYSEDNAFFYNFSSNTTLIWTNDDTYYHVSYSASVNSAAQLLVWGEPIADPDDYVDVITGIGAEYDTQTAAVTNINLTFGFGVASGGYYVSNGKYKNFGNAEDNSFDSTLTSLIESLAD